MDCFKVRKWRLRQEPDESRGSRPVLRGPWGAVPRGYSACAIEAHIEMRVVPSTRLSEGGSNH